MRTETWTFRSFAVAAGLLVLTLTASATAGDYKTSVERIAVAPPATIHDTHVIPASDRYADAHYDRGHDASESSYSTGSLDQGQVYEGPSVELTGNHFVDFWKIRKMKMGSWMTRMRLKAYGNGGEHGWRSRQGRRSLRDKAGYFYPTGCGGGGCPVFGKYDMVYSTNPTYFDPRDGRLYAAQGYNAPMSVPLAPNVRYAYNYGWGVPSSRLTRVSRVAPEIPVLRTGR